MYSARGMQKWSTFMNEIWATLQIKLDYTKNVLQTQ
jgi:hypothetical protein